MIAWMENWRNRYGNIDFIEVLDIIKEHSSDILKNRAFIDMTDKRVTVTIEHIDKINNTLKNEIAKQREDMDKSIAEARRDFHTEMEEVNMNNRN